MNGSRDVSGFLCVETVTDDQEEDQLDLAISCYEPRELGYKHELLYPEPLLHYAETYRSHQEDPTNICQGVEI
jgi:hypothetical protein